MSHIRTLRWSEGMFIRSHHFQQWDAHLADRLRRFLDAALPDSWGLLDFAESEEALREGRLELTRLAAIFPSGTFVVYPGNCPIPAAEFRERLTRVGASLGAHIGVKILDPEAPNAPNTEDASGPVRRFRTKSDTVNDVNSGHNPQSVEFLEYDVRILFDGDDMQGYETIKVAQIRRGTQQARPFEFSDDYAPPCLRLGASKVLSDEATKVVGWVHKKAGDLHQEKVRLLRSDGRIDRLLFCQAVHSFLPVLLTEVQSGDCHPRRAFSIIASLAGALACGWPDRDPRRIVENRIGEKEKYRHYEHSNPLPEFRYLCAQVVQDLERIDPGQFEATRLTRDGDYFVKDGLTSAPFEPGARVYLAIDTRRDRESVRTALSGVLKVGSGSDVKRRVEGMLPGVPVTESSPPSEYPERGPIFYVLTSAGDTWRSIEADRALGAFVPTGDAEANVLLVVVYGQERS